MATVTESEFPAKITEGLVGTIRAYRDGLSYVLVDDEGNEYWYTETTLRNSIAAAQWALEVL